MKNAKEKYTFNNYFCNNALWLRKKATVAEIDDLFLLIFLTLF
jgi:hypothetical protein